VVSIQSSYTSPSKYMCSSPLGNLVSCSLLISWFCSLSCLSYADVICGTSYLCSYNCLSYGIVICGTFVFDLAAYTTIGTTLTTIGTVDGSTLPFIIFCALTSMLSCSSSLLSLRLLLLQLCSSS
jgi:hypothetical protein